MRETEPFTTELACKVRVQLYWQLNLSGGDIWTPVVIPGQGLANTLIVLGLTSLWNIVGRAPSSGFVPNSINDFV